MQLHTIYKVLYIAYAFANILSASTCLICTFTCIGYTPTHIYIGNYMYHMHGTHVLYLHLHVSHMRLHVLMSNYMYYIRTYMHYTVKRATYAATCFLFTRHANMYNICMYMHYTCITRYD